MRLSFEDITDRHKNKPCAVVLHGPSLNKDRDKISQLQREKNLIRFSVNDWYDFFDVKPDYWVISNSEFTIKASIVRNHLWAQRNYVHDVFNKFKVPLLYNATADLTDLDFVDKNLLCDYMPYDARHFRGHDCLNILKNFKKHYEKNKNLNFTYYGNNAKPWDRPNIKGLPEWKQKLHGRIGNGWDPSGECCRFIDTITIQEKLQQHAGHKQHAGPGHTVGLTAIMFAILMGCSPIYISGLDLDYRAGYAEGKKSIGHNEGHIDHWKVIFRDFLLDDMRILKESAVNLGIKIINLNKNSWHNVFEKGDLLVGGSV